MNKLTVEEIREVFEDLSMGHEELDIEEKICACVMFRHFVDDNFSDHLSESPEFDPNKLREYLNDKIMRCHLIVRLDDMLPPSMLLIHEGDTRDIRERRWHFLNIAADIFVEAHVMLIERMGPPEEAVILGTEHIIEIMNNKIDESSLSESQKALIKRRAQEHVGANNMIIVRAFLEHCPFTLEDIDEMWSKHAGGSSILKDDYRKSHPDDSTEIIEAFFSIYSASVKLIIKEYLAYQEQKKK